MRQLINERFTFKGYRVGNPCFIRFQGLALAGADHVSANRTWNRVGTIARWPVLTMYG